MVKNKTKYYVLPKELHKELMNWKTSGIMTDELGDMFLNLVEGFAQKRNFSGYTWIEEMRGEAIEFLVKYAKNYNPKKKNANAFAYCSTIIWCAFVQIIQKEKKHTELRKNIYENIMINDAIIKEDDLEELSVFKKCNNNNYVMNDLILDLVEDYDQMIDMLKKENLRKLNINGK